jgi:hypothetical protein
MGGAHVYGPQLCAARSETRSSPCFCSEPCAVAPLTSDVDNTLTISLVRCNHTSRIGKFHRFTPRPGEHPASLLLRSQYLFCIKKEGNHPHGHLFLAGAPGTSSLRVLRCAPLLLLAPDPRARLALPALRFGACSSGSCGSCEACLLPPKRFLTHPKVSLFSSTHPSSVYGACSSLAR